MKACLRVLWVASMAALPLAHAMAEEIAPPPGAALAPPAATAPQTATADQDRLICKTERVTGSNMPKRVCLTAAQRQAAHDASQDFMDQNSRKHSSFKGG